MLSHNVKESLRCDTFHPLSLTVRKYRPTSTDRSLYKPWRLDESLQREFGVGGPACLLGVRSPCLPPTVTHHHHLIPPKWHLSETMPRVCVQYRAQRRRRLIDGRLIGRDQTGRSLATIRRTCKGLGTIQRIHSQGYSALSGISLVQWAKTRGDAVVHFSREGRVPSIFLKST